MEVKRVEPYFCSILVESLFPLVLGGAIRLLREDRLLYFIHARHNIMG